MKIYSDVLTEDDLRGTIKAVPGMFIERIKSIKDAKVRLKGWTLLTASWSGNRYCNSGTHGATGTQAASWDDHGRWFAALYAIDPNARIARYTDAADFHKQTDGRYRPTLAR